MLDNILQPFSCIIELSFDESMVRIMWSSAPLDISIKFAQSADDVSDCSINKACSASSAQRLFLRTNFTIVEVVADLAETSPARQLEARRLSTAGGTAKSMPLLGYDFPSCTELLMRSTMTPQLFRVFSWSGLADNEDKTRLAFSRTPLAFSFMLPTCDRYTFTTERMTSASIHNCLLRWSLAHRQARAMQAQLTTSRLLA
mmetsp:Transcript_42754/g.129932  ORF Transcript_42754/g.129932 Transcript_42754/m.129932 type:complete len:201 (+) Transcript_42754:2118-2720(+)